MRRKSPIIVLDYFRKPISKNDIDSLSEFLQIVSRLVPIYDKIMNLQSDIIRERVNSKLCRLQNIEIAIMQQLKEPEQITQWKESMDKMKKAFVGI